MRGQTHRIANSLVEEKRTSTVNQAPEYIYLNSLEFRRGYHRRGQNHANISSGVRNNQCLEDGPRSVLHLSVSSIYSTGFQPSL